MNNDGRIFLRVRFHLEFIYYLVNLRGRNVATSIINIRTRPNSPAKLTDPLSFTDGSTVHLGL